MIASGVKAKEQADDRCGRFHSRHFNPNMRIEYLADHEEHLSTVAAWQQTEFGYLNPSITIEQRRSRLREALQKEGLPVTLIAISKDGTPVGFASVLSKTITHMHLTPWLSTIVVPPEHRGKGIASALSLRAAAEAARLGFDSVYLFTPRNESLYQRLGREILERSTHNGLPIAIMSRKASLASHRSEPLSLAAMPMLRRIHHAAIICSNYDVSRRFYTEVLGLKVLTEHYREHRQSYKLDLALPDGSQLELFSFPQSPARPSYPEACGLCHLAFEVENVEACKTELESRGVAVEPVRIDEYTNQLFVFFADPDGLPLELYETSSPHDG